MCGIAGILAPGDSGPPSVESLRRMAGALRHRGPDESGLYRDRTAGLTNARLSIIDLRTGQQPVCNEDGTVWVVQNGEIFNYIELRQELASLGHLFRTQSDTEVIVHAWEAWGEAAFERFNGQFAIALWDAPRRRLVLARDRYGICPLHVCGHEGKVFFASEVKAIFAAAPSIPREFDPLGFDEAFTFWAALPPRTVFRGVSELPPGCVRTYEDGRVREREIRRPCYPGRDSPAFAGSIEDAARDVRERLGEAVKLRLLRSDVPVGCYLSGGLDSSFIAALGARAVGGNLLTFSLRFSDAEYDETAHQLAMVGRLGSVHRDVIVSRRDIASVFPEVVEHAEKPILRAAPAPLFLLSRLVQEAGIKVVLTGEGGDEMFGGYDLFREGKVRRFWARRPQSTMRPRLLEKLYPYLARSPVATRTMAQSFFGRGLDRWQSPGFAHEPRWRTTSALKRLFAPAFRSEIGAHDAVAALLETLPPEFAGWADLARDQYLEIRTLMSPYLLSSQGDRMLMSHGVEGRFPYLDREVAALADSLPPEYKLRVLDEKHVLKRAAEGFVPGEILQRKKQPYRVPDALSFSGAHPPEWVEEVTCEDAVREAGVFDPSAVARLRAKLKAHGEDQPLSNSDNMAMVGVLSTQILHRRFIRKPLPAAEPGRFITFVDRVEP